MSETPRPDNLNEPSFGQGNEVWRLAIGLDLPEGVEFFRDPYDKHYIRVDQEVPYPREPEQLPPNTRELILKKSDLGEDVYRLPTNSSTLITILNEAAGATDSFDVSPDQSRTVGILKGLFSRLADSLDGARAEGLMPEHLDYKQVLVTKDEYGCKLLPPVEFTPVTDRASAKESWQRLSQDLTGSIAREADTAAQRRLASTIKDPIKQLFDQRGRP